MKGKSTITQLEIINGQILARVPRNDLIGKQAQRVRTAIMRSLHPDTQKPYGVREILHLSKDMFQNWYMSTMRGRTEEYYKQCRTEALRLEALDAYYYERATEIKQLRELTDAEWDTLDPWDTYLLMPEFETIPFDRHRAIIDQLKERVRAEKKKEGV